MPSLDYYYSSPIPATEDARKVSEGASCFQASSLGVITPAWCGGNAGILRLLPQPRERAWDHPRGARTYNYLALDEIHHPLGRWPGRRPPEGAPAAEIRGEGPHWRRLSTRNWVAR